MTTYLNWKDKKLDGKTYDVAIIGAGIAGLTAAIYARRAHKSVIVFEQRTHGGQIIQTFHIENWPGEECISGVDLMNNVFKQTEKLRANFEYLDIQKIEKDGDLWKLSSDDYWYKARSIIIATGSNEKKLDIPGEEKFISRGVSYCATCDGAFYHDKTVAVVGGGNTAFYDALYLADICKKVYLIHRRNEFRADEHLVEKVQKKKNVEFLTPFAPQEILGDKKVNQLKIASRDGEERLLEVDGVFVAVGRTPSTSTFDGLVDLDEGGYIKAGEDCKTSTPSIYVAGDVRTKEVRQLVTAAADGAVAATEAVRNLS
ncbi:MAG: thioredoxin-disulfide reductase [Candidatus Saccharibacteria bacterium]|nr:thioredoxin-disulfide reductase [Candidatus Saccharibacteria bacterium]